MRGISKFWAAALLASAASAALARDMVDVLIRGGTVHDGAGGAGYVGDVALRGDRIVFVGRHADVDARRTIDAKGMIVAPGFIDPHTHANHFLDSPDPLQRRAPAWLAQGVTTLFIGVDGAGVPEVADSFAKLKAAGVGVNVAAYVGFGAIRPRVVGQVKRAPTAAELAAEKALVAKGMCEGAIGLSTGLFYVPQSYADTPEVIELAREAARRGGVYDTHARDYSDFTVGMMNSYREALEIGRAAGLPVHLSHIKTLGPGVWGRSAEVVALVDAARAAGQKVTASQYPYTGNGTSISAMFVPNWALDGGREALLKRLDDPATLARVKAEMTANLERTGGASNFLFRGRGEAWSGKYLDAVARDWGVSPVDAALRILREGRGQSMIGFVMSPVDIANFMKQPWTMTDSDGGEGHPREYGTFPLKYRDYVVKDKVIDLPFFIRNSSGLTADTFGIRERGYLRPGYFADVLVFDPVRYAPKNDFARYDVLADGVVELFVNGKAAVEAGTMTTALAGVPLPHAPTPGTCPQ